MPSIGRTLVLAAAVTLAVFAPSPSRAEAPPAFLLEFGSGCT